MRPIAASATALATDVVRSPARVTAASGPRTAPGMAPARPMPRASMMTSWARSHSRQPRAYRVAISGPRSQMLRCSTGRWPPRARPRPGSRWWRCNPRRGRVPRRHCPGSSRPPFPGRRGDGAVGHRHRNSTWTRFRRTGNQGLASDAALVEPVQLGLLRRGDRGDQERVRRSRPGRRHAQVPSHRMLNPRGSRSPCPHRPPEN